MVSPEIRTCVEHVTAMLVSTVHCFLAQGPERLTEFLHLQRLGNDQQAALPESGLVGLWADVFSVVTDCMNDLVYLQSFSELESDRYSMQQFERAWEMAWSQAAVDGAPPSVAACVNATKWSYSADTANDEKNQNVRVVGYRQDFDLDVERLAKVLFPALHQQACTTVGGPTATVIADRLRQRLLRAQLDQHRHRLSDNCSPGERSQVGYALLDSIRLYVQEQNNEICWGTEEQVLKCLTLLSTRELNCVRVPDQGGIQYHLASALLTDTAEKLPEFQGDALAACLAELPNVPGEQFIDQVPTYRHQSTAIEIRRWICHRLFREITLDKHSFEQLMEHLRIALLEMDRNMSEAPDRLEGVSLCELLATCQLALDHVQLTPSEQDKVPPALLWVQHQREFQLLNRFVGSPPGSVNETRRQVFQEPGGLLDPSAPTSPQVSLLLRRAEEVCEFVVRLGASELDTLSLANDAPGEQDLPGSRDTYSKELKGLRTQCQCLAAELRARGATKEAARLDKVGSTEVYVGAAVEHMKAIIDEIKNIQSVFGRRTG